MDSKIKQRVSLSAFFFLSGFCFFELGIPDPDHQNSLWLQRSGVGQHSARHAHQLPDRPPLFRLAGHQIRQPECPYRWALLLYAMCLSLYWLCQHHRYACGGASSCLRFACGYLIFHEHAGHYAAEAVRAQNQRLFSWALEHRRHCGRRLYHLDGVSWMFPLYHICCQCRHRDPGDRWTCYRFLLRNDRAAAGNKLAFGKPDPYILYLGLLVFFAAICEGGMFDWSGIYFQEVVREDIFTLRLPDLHGVHGALAVSFRPHHRQDRYARHLCYERSFYFLRHRAGYACCRVSGPPWSGFRW